MSLLCINIKKDTIVMFVKTWWQEFQAAGHTVFTPRKQKEMDDAAHLGFPLLSNWDSSLWDGANYSHSSAWLLLNLPGENILYT